MATEMHNCRERGEVPLVEMEVVVVRVEGRTNDVTDVIKYPSLLDPYNGHLPNTINKTS